MSGFANRQEMKTIVFFHYPESTESWSTVFSLLDKRSCFLGRRNTQKHKTEQRDDLLTR